MGERLSGLLQDLRQTLSGASGMADSNQQLAGTFLLRADDITRQIQQAAGQLADVDQHGQSIQHAAGHSSSLAGAVRANLERASGELSRAHQEQGPGIQQPFEQEFHAPQHSSMVRTHGLTPGHAPAAPRGIWFSLNWHFVPD